MCHEQFYPVDYNSHLTTSHVFPSKNVSFSSAIVAYFFANMIIRFFDSQKNIVAKRGKKTKGISDKEDILDYMSSTELAANLFRITQTDEVLKNKNINNEDDACITHHKVGQAVRQTIKKIGGTMPEDLPTPTKSAKQIEKEKNKEIAFKDNKKLKK